MKQPLTLAQAAERLRRGGTVKQLLGAGDRWVRARWDESRDHYFVEVGAGLRVTQEQSFDDELAALFHMASLGGEETGFLADEDAPHGPTSLPN